MAEFLAYGLLEAEIRRLRDQFADGGQPWPQLAEEGRPVLG